MCFPSGSDSKQSACSAGDPGSIPTSGRSPGEGNGYPLQYSCLENFMDREAWQALCPWDHRVRHDGSNLACTNACFVKFSIFPGEAADFVTSQS